MRHLISLTFVLFFITAPLVAQQKQSGAAKNDQPIRFRLGNDGFLCEVARVDADGTVVLNTAKRGIRGAPAQIALTEGFYLGLAAERASQLPHDALFMRVRITEVLDSGRARLNVGPEAVSHFESIRVIFLFRPAGSTTAQMKSAPSVTRIVDATHEISGMPNEKARQLAVSRKNLKRIGIALHNFHDTHQRFPPAIVYGPDGKPWHSWRVLLLPFLDEMKLYQRYRLDEPWNGPNNKKVLAEMPSVFHDPVHGDKRGILTHYAAVIGRNSGFTPTGGRFNGAADNLGAALKGGTAMRQFIDGTSHSVLVGSVSPTAKIPWTKPQDVPFGDTFPGIGKKGGFAAPFHAKAGTAGLFLRADGSVATIRQDIDKELLRRLLTINDRQVVTPAPTIDPPGLQARRRKVAVIEIRRTGKDVQVRLMFEFDERQRPKPGQTGSTPTESAPETSDGAAADSRE